MIHRQSHSHSLLIDTVKLLVNNFENSIRQQNMLAIMADNLDMNREEVRQRFKTVGDLGLLGYQLHTDKYDQGRQRQEQSIPALVLTLDTLDQMQGKHSVQQKQHLVSQVLDQQGSAEEYMFMVRLLMGNLRIGVHHKSIVQAILTLDPHLATLLQTQVFQYSITHQPTILHGVPIQ